MKPFATSISGRLAVIGDLHGHVDKLDKILTQLSNSNYLEDRWVVFLGDYLDRGPDPKKVIQRIIDFQKSHPKTTAIAGNHDLAFSCAMGWSPEPPEKSLGKLWLDEYDSQTTFSSYGAKFQDIKDLENQFPEEHREWLLNLPWCVEHPEYLFVHAGLSTDQTYIDQFRSLKNKDLSSGIPPWLFSKELSHAVAPPDSPVTVVTGHGFVPYVEHRENRILMDTTGGFEENKLSCLLLPEFRAIRSHKHEHRNKIRKPWFKTIKKWLPLSK